MNRTLGEDREVHKASTARGESRQYSIQAHMHLPRTHVCTRVRVLCRTS